jgi:SAM-dependent methyltransferase
MTSESADEDVRRRAHAESFGSAADAYERGRPSYPSSAIEWLLPSGARTAVDLGAGTGQLTRLLASYDLDVVAVEPSTEMRKNLSRTLPSTIRSLAGQAEKIPLPNSSVDVVLVAQAWHWVDGELAVPEVARILKPGGQLGLVWNIRDERVDWVAALGQLMHNGTEQEMNSDNPIVGNPFDPIERFDVEWTAHLDLDTVVDLVASRSYVITRPEEQRLALLDAVKELLSTHPQLKGSTSVAMPYVTRCSRTRLSK